MINEGRLVTILSQAFIFSDRFASKEINHYTSLINHLQLVRTGENLHPDGVLAVAVMGDADVVVHRIEHIVDVSLRGHQAVKAFLWGERFRAPAAGEVFAITDARGKECGGIVHNIIEHGVGAAASSLAWKNDES